MKTKERLGLAQYGAGIRRVRRPLAPGRHHRPHPPAEEGERGGR